MADFDIQYKVSPRDRYTMAVADTWYDTYTFFTTGDLAAADYVFCFFGRSGGENAAAVFGTRFLFDGTQQGTDRLCEPNTSWANSGNQIMQIIRHTTAADEVVKMQGKNVDSTNRINVPRIAAFAFNVDDIGTGNYLYNQEATPVNGGPSTYTNKAQVTIPAGSTDDWLVFFEGEFTPNNTAAEMYVRIHDGTNELAESENIEQSEDTRERLHIGGYRIVSGAASSFTLSVQVSTDGNADYIASRVFAFKLNAAADYSTYDRTVDYNVAATATEYTMWSAQVSDGTVSETGDYFVFPIAKVVRTNTASRTATSVWARKNAESYAVFSDSNYATNVPTTSGAGSDGCLIASYSNAVLDDWNYPYTVALTSGDDYDVQARVREYTDVTTSLDLTRFQVAMFSRAKAAAGAQQGAWTDGASVSDALAANVDIQAAVSEALTVSDVYSAAAHFLASVDESLTVADTDTGIAAVLRALAEATTANDVLDAFVRFGGALAEAVQVSDTLQTQIDALAELIETINISDARTASVAVQSLLQADASVADIWATAAANQGDLAESASAADAWEAIAALLGSVADGASVADAFLALANVNGATSEAMSVADQYAAGVALLESLTESLSASDIWAATVSGVNEGILIEAATVSDSLTALAQVLAETTNAALVSDAFAGITGNEGATVDAVTVSDAFIGSALILSALAESLTVSDAWLTVSGNVGQLSDVISVAGLWAAQSAIGSALADSAFITDAFTSTIAGSAALAFSLVVADEWSEGDALGIVLGAIRLYAALDADLDIYSAVSGSVSVRRN